MSQSRAMPSRPPPTALRVATLLLTALFLPPTVAIPWALPLLPPTYDGLHAQEPAPVPADPPAADTVPDDGPSLRLTVGDVGLGIGHVPRITGLRINWADRRLERVTGVNLTFWRPAGRRVEGAVGGELRGVALGLVPRTGKLRGVGLGLGGVVGEEALDGIHLAGGATASGGALRGLAVAGLAAVGGESSAGVHVSGLATVTGGSARGVQLGGLAVVAGDELTGLQASGLAVIGGSHVRGIQLGGFAAVAGEDLEGIQMGGLTTVGGERVRGLQLSPLAVVGGGDMTGIQGGGAAVVAGGAATGLKIGGLAVVGGETLDGVQLGGAGVVSGCRMRGVQVSAGWVETRRDIVELRRGVPEEAGLPAAQSPGGCTDPGIAGITVAGLRLRTGHLDGLSVAGAWIDADRVRGLSVAGIQRTGLQVGLSIGLVNWADELHGVQLGLVNRAGNNPPPFRVLPLLNVHL